MKTLNGVMNDVGSRDYWNIVKAIGIICVVFGHSCTNFPRAVNFVYLFHLPLFFFVSGYLWSEEKYGNDPFLNFAARLRTNYGKYIFAAAVFIALHNVFVSTGILINSPVYTVNDIMISMCTSLILNCTELMSSSMWFIPLIILGSTFFTTVVMIARRSARTNSNPNVLKYSIILVLSIVLGYLGVYATTRNWGFNYNIQIALLIVPFYACAYFAKKLTHQTIEGYVKWYFALPLAVCLWLGMERLGWSVTLGNNTLGNPVAFYAGSFAGIYVCLSLGALLMKAGFLRKAMSFVGRYSFEIMAWHLLVIKVIDLGFAAVIGEGNAAVYGVFTNAYASSLWWLYLSLGVGVPAVVASGAGFMIRQFRQLRRHVTRA